MCDCSHQCCSLTELYLLRAHLVFRGKNCQRKAGIKRKNAEQVYIKLKIEKQWKWLPTHIQISGRDGRETKV